MISFHYESPHKLPYYYVCTTRSSISPPYRMYAYKATILLLQHFQAQNHSFSRCKFLPNISCTIFEAQNSLQYQAKAPSSPKNKPIKKAFWTIWAQSLLSEFYRHLLKSKNYEMGIANAKVNLNNSASKSSFVLVGQMMWRPRKSCQKDVKICQTNFYPLCPNSDKHLISPYSITT